MTTPAATRTFSCDSERLAFLDALQAVHARGAVVLSDWEFAFIRSAQRYQGGAILFSDKQRTIIDRLLEQHSANVYP